MKNWKEVKMNKLNEIFSTTFTDALGWTLFHSLWQGAVIAVVLFLLLSVTRQSQARIRYFMTVGRSNLNFGGGSGYFYPPA